MNLFVIFICLLGLLVAPVMGSLELHPSISSSAMYTAASIQYSPKTLAASSHPSDIQALQLMRSNLQSITPLIEKAAQQNAQILVLAEQGLSGWPYTKYADVTPYLQTLPDNTDIPLCPAEIEQAALVSYLTNDATFDNSKASELLRKHSYQTGASPFLIDLACMAKHHGILLVVDVAVKVPCDNTTICGQSGEYWQFNTQIAFGIEGSILSYYFKNHLYVGEDKIFDTPPKIPTLRYFDSHFGVRFGQVVCFDIFFRGPLIQLAQSMGIQDFVFSTWWNNNGAYPLISATMIQQGVSRVLKANFIAANEGYTYLQAGSGIYSNGWALEFTYNTTDFISARLLLAKLPKNISGSNHGVSQQNHGTNMLRTDHSFTRMKSMATKHTPNLRQVANNHKPPLSTLANNHKSQQKKLAGNHRSPLRKVADNQRPLRTLADIPMHSLSLQKSLHLNYPSNITNSMTIQPFSIHAGAAATLSAVHNGFRCTLDYAVQHSSKVHADDMFALIALNGYYFNPLLPAQVCAVTLCPNKTCDIANLPLVGAKGVSFTRFSLKGIFAAPFGSDQVVIPMALGNNGQPTEYNSYFAFNHHLESSDLMAASLDLTSLFTPQITNALLYTTSKI